MSAVCDSVDAKGCSVRNLSSDIAHVLEEKDCQSHVSSNRFPPKCSPPRKKRRSKVSSRFISPSYSASSPRPRRTEPLLTRHFEVTTPKFGRTQSLPRNLACFNFGPQEYESVFTNNFADLGSRELNHRFQVFYAEHSWYSALAQSASHKLEMDDPNYPGYFRLSPGE